MPIVIQNNKLQIRNAEGNYVNIDAVSDATVEERITEINAIGASNIAAINTKAQEVNAQLATSSEMESMIAETFNINTSYNEGTYVIQDDNGVNKLYRFNVDHAAGDWNDNEVTQVTMGEEFQNLENNAQADVDDLKSAIIAVATGTAAKAYPSFQLGYTHGVQNATPQNPAHNSYNDTICTTDYIDIAVAKELTFDAQNYNICVAYYDSGKVYQKFVGFTATPNPYVLDTQYAYCVAELRKKDVTAFTASEVANANGTLYYDDTIETDIVRHAEFDALDDKIDSISTKKLINPELFTPPINVYRSNTGYECDMPYTDISEFVKIYVDSANGDDANDGTSLNAPIKTLYQAEYLMRKKAQTTNSVEIIIKDGSVFYYDDIPSAWDVKYSMILRAEGHAKIFAGKKGTWSASSNHYVSGAFADMNIIGCVDTTDTDEYGLYNPMQFLSSESDVENTPNSYYIDTTNKVVYVHPKAGADVNDIVVLFGNKYTAQISARLAESDMFIYVQGIDFVGNSTAKGKTDASLSDAIKRTIYFKDCSFQHGCSNNVISVNDYRYTYFVGCVGGYGKFDVWNYHFTLQSDPVNSVVVEVDCAGKESGYYSGVSGTSDQISTCHDGANILRCNTHGYNSDGSLIADVNGCYTVCLDCTVINTSYVGSSGANYAPYRFDNAQATRDGKTVLQNCFGYDSRNAMFVTAVDLTLNGVNGTGSISANKLTVGRHMI